MIESFEISDLLLRLVDRSLVTYDEATGRYYLLETVRQYAAEHVLATDDSLRTKNRHFDYYFRLIEGTRQKVRGDHPIEWLARLDAEYDNIRLAHDWVISQNDRWSDAMKMAHRLQDYWTLRSNFGEESAVLERLRPGLATGSPAEHAAFLILQGWLDYFMKVFNLSNAGKAVEAARKSGDESLIADALANEVITQSRAGRLEEAEARVPEAVEILERVGDIVMAGFLNINLGNAYFLKGEIDVAERYYRECLRLRRKSRDLRGVGAAISSLAAVHEARGETDIAIRFYRQGLSAFATVGSAWDLAGTIYSVGLEFSLAGKDREGALILGCADALLKKIRAERDEVDTLQYFRRKKTIEERLSADEFREAYQQGLNTSVEAILQIIFPNGLEIPSMDETSDAEQSG